MKSIKKFIAAIAATASLTTCMFGISASAQTIYNSRSSGGSYGYMYYDLSTTGSYLSFGTYSYRLHAESTQTLPNGGSYVPIREINYDSAIYLTTGGKSTATKTYTTRDASWDTPAVAANAVVSSPEKGYVTHHITSNYYGYIMKTVKNN